MATDRSITDELSSFVAEADCTDLTPEVVRSTTMHIIDWFGCVLAGSRSETGRIALSSRLNGCKGGGSTMIGNDHTVSPSSAALANGIMSHSVELDDVDRLSLAHPGVTIIPAALAVAEQLKCSGQNLILAVALGYEIFSRIGQAIVPECYRRGWHSTGICGIFGAATACSKLLGAAASEVQSALGNAGTLAAGLQQYAHEGAMSKCLHAGHAASLGLIAADISVCGLTGAHFILEGESGVLKIFAPSKYSHADDLPTAANQILDSLPVTGTKRAWRILKTSFKPYACVRPFHPAVQELLSLMNRERLSADSIESIVVRTNMIPYKYFAGDSIPTPYAAMLNIKYTLALVAATGRADHRVFTEEALRRPEVIRLASRVQILEDPNLSRKLPGSLTACVIDVVRTDRGRILRSEPAYALGDPENPMTEPALEEKFKDLGGDAIGPADTIRILASLRDLQNIEDVAVFMSELRRALCITQ